jgi:hypothetical protein
MVQQMMLTIILPEKTNQIVLVTGSKQNKWGLGTLKKKFIHLIGSQTRDLQASSIMP